MCVLVGRTGSYRATYRDNGGLSEWNDGGMSGGGEERDGTERAGRGNPRGSSWSDVSAARLCCCCALYSRVYRWAGGSVVERCVSSVCQAGVLGSVATFVLTVYFFVMLWFQCFHFERSSWFWLNEK